MTAVPRLSAAGLVRLGEELSAIGSKIGVR